MKNPEIEPFILRRLAGRTFLHLGVLGNWCAYLKNDLDFWAFKKFSDVASRAVGLDLDKKGVEAVRSAGVKNVFHGNAESFQLDEIFDVIYAGDVIEHLNNPGSFLASCRQHMNENSELILTTPNPFSLPSLLKGLFRDAGHGIFHEHTFLFHPRNLSLLLRRHGFRVKLFFYFSPLAKKGLALQVKTGLISLAGQFKKNFHASFAFVVARGPGKEKTRL
jgi:SAM-dependent methyltransferase